MTTVSIKISGDSLICTCTKSVWIWSRSRPAELPSKPIKRTNLWLLLAYRYCMNYDCYKKIWTVETQNWLSKKMELNYQKMKLNCQNTELNCQKNRNDLPIYKTEFPKFENKNWTVKKLNCELPEPSQFWKDFIDFETFCFVFHLRATINLYWESVDLKFYFCTWKHIFTSTLWVHIAFKIIWNWIKISQCHLLSYYNNKNRPFSEHVKNLFVLEKNNISCNASKK